MFEFGLKDKDGNITPVSTDEGRQWMGPIETCPGCGAHFVLASGEEYFDALYRWMERHKPHVTGQRA